MTDALSTNSAAPLEQRCPGCGEWHILADGLCSECNAERIEEAGG